MGNGLTDTLLRTDTGWVIVIYLTVFDILEGMVTAIKKRKSAHINTHIMVQFEGNDGINLPTITKDETLGGLDVTVDAAMITDTGQWVKDSADAVSGLVYTKEDGLGGNTQGVVENVSKAGGNLGATIVNHLTGNGNE